VFTGPNWSKISTLVGLRRKTAQIIGVEIFNPSVNSSSYINSFNQNKLLQFAKKNLMQ
jgi:hypothetical protein